MSVYLKITLALALAASTVELNAWVGDEGGGHLLMAFVYAGFLLAGAFFFVSAVEKFHRENAAVEGYAKRTRGETAYPGNRNFSKQRRTALVKI